MALLASRNLSAYRIWSGSLDGDEFGRYRLISLIGQGGMGKVYRAHDTLMQRDVAIKVLPVELAMEPGYRERFQREAFTAARLNEPHIIPIHESGEFDGHLYLVMPVIDGTDLGVLLQRDGPLSAQRALRIVQQLAQALDTAHAAGLVHRDVKPSNALITRHDTAYLIDFGVAHDSAATQLTGTGILVGTLAYMAPERFSAGVADSRADVYALACLFYECLTAAQPFAGDSLAQQMHAHLVSEPPRPSARQVGVPPGFDEVIARGMAKDPDQRYRTAGELANAAEHALLVAGTANTLNAQIPHREEHTFHRAALPSGQSTPDDGSSGRPRRRRSIISPAVGVIAVGAVVAIVAFALDGRHRVVPSTSTAGPTSITSATTSPNSPAPAPPLAASALQPLLLSPADTAIVMGVAAMTVSGERVTLQNDATVVTPPDCQHVENSGDPNAYAGSGWTDARGENVGSLPGNDVRLVVQDVVLFPSAAAASSFAAASLPIWQKCANSRYTEAGNGNTFNWIAGPLISGANGMISVALDGRSQSKVVLCQRALTAKNNVVIDVAACATAAIPEAAVTLVSQVAARIPA
jgi:serine/threonine protein kinase